MIIESINTNTIWNPPMLLGSGILGPAIGIGALMMLSKLPTMIPEFIFQIKPSPIGKAIGESFAPIGKAASGYAKYGVDAGVKWTNKTLGSPGTSGGTRTTSQSIIHGLAGMWSNSRKKH
jgi:hypothetical protein